MFIFDLHQQPMWCKLWREMVKGELPVDSFSRGIAPIVASVLQNKAQHLVSQKNFWPVLWGWRSWWSCWWPFCEGWGERPRSSSRCAPSWSGRVIRFTVWSLSLWWRSVSVMVMSVDDWICIDEWFDWRPLVQGSLRPHIQRWPTPPLQQSGSQAPATTKVDIAAYCI